MSEVFSPKNFQSDLTFKLTANRKKSWQGGFGEENSSVQKKLLRQFFSAKPNFPVDLETVIVPEPAESRFLGEVLRSDNNKFSIFKNHLANFKHLSYEQLESSPHFNCDNAFKDTAFLANNYWFNTTEKGINLRPGFFYEDGEIRNSAVDECLVLGEDGVHGLVAGVTGSGKSVFLNHLLTTLMMEYPSWELDLYLMDFKKVEFSVYLSNTDFQAPHVKAVGATEEMEYVMSVFRHLRECLIGREKLFQSLDGLQTSKGSINVKNIADFREFGREHLGVNLVLPRVLLVIDEFQQLFLNTSPRQQRELNKTLEILTKKGRALGIHLLFASQDMSNTLSSSMMSNFGIRFALPMDEDNSYKLLGSKDAKNLEVGQVLSFTSRSIENNSRFKKFKVPFDNSSESNSDIPSQLKILGVLEKETGFSKEKVFYQEDELKSFQILPKIQKACKPAIQHLLSETGFLHYLLLGPATSYYPQANKFEEMFIAAEKKNGLALLADNDEKMAYLIRLILQNLLGNQTATKLSIFSFDDKIEESMGISFEKLATELGCGDCKIIPNEDTLGMLSFLNEHYSKGMNDSEKEVDSLEKIKGRLMLFVGIEKSDELSRNGEVAKYLSNFGEAGAIPVICCKVPTDYDQNQLIKQICRHQLLFSSDEKNFDGNQFEYSERSIDSPRIEYKNVMQHRQVGFKMMDLPQLKPTQEPTLHIPSELFN